MVPARWEAAQPPARVKGPGIRLKGHLHAQSDNPLQRPCVGGHVAPHVRRRSASPGAEATRAALSRQPRSQRPREQEVCAGCGEPHKCTEKRLPRWCHEQGTAQLCGACAEAIQTEHSSGSGAAVAGGERYTVRAIIRDGTLLRCLQCGERSHLFAGCPRRVMPSQRRDREAATPSGGGAAPASTGADAHASAASPGAGAAGGSLQGGPDASAHGHLPPPPPQHVPPCGSGDRVMAWVTTPGTLQGGASTDGAWLTATVRGPSGGPADGRGIVVRLDANAAD
eukprot:gene4052-11044_t